MWVCSIELALGAQLLWNILGGTRESLILWHSSVSKNQKKIGYFHSVCKYQYTEGYTKLQGLRARHKRGACVILVKEGTNRDWSHSEDQYLMSIWWALIMGELEGHKVLLQVSVREFNAREFNSNTFDFTVWPRGQAKVGWTQCAKATFYINLNCAMNCGYTTCTAKHGDWLSWKQSNLEVQRTWRLELCETRELFLLFSVCFCYLIMCYARDVAHRDK